MTLPAITLCLTSFLPNSTYLTLDRYLYHCSISGARCGYNDFYSFEIRTSFRNTSMTCYVVNGGRNSSGHSSEIKSTKTTDFNSGFQLVFFLPKRHLLFYYINDAYVKPTSSELESLRFTLPNSVNYFKLEKSIESKLEFPFNNCSTLRNLPNSVLIRQLSEANITYRQINCFELCFHNYMKNYALEHKISEDEARLKKEVTDYDKTKNCNHLCPLECETTQYRILESKFYLNDFDDTNSQRSSLIAEIENKLNITINSTENVIESFLQLTVTFDNLRYTKISQTQKTTFSALVSNIGGYICKKKKKFCH